MKVINFSAMGMIVFGALTVGQYTGQFGCGLNALSKTEAVIAGIAMGIGLFYYLLVKDFFEEMK